MNDVLTEQEAFQSPVFIVMGANWICEVKLNKIDFILNLVKKLNKETGEVEEKLISFDDFIIDEEKDMVYTYDFLSAEICTKAVEIFKGLKEGKIELLEGEKEPQMGSVLYAYLKDGDSNKGAYVPSFICLANAGFYGDCLITYNDFSQEMLLAEKEEKLRKAQLKKKKLNIKKKNKK